MRRNPFAARLTKLERLEDRTTPNYTVSLVGTTVTIDSDAGDASDLQIEYNAGSDEYTLSDAGGIVFDDTTAGAAVTAGDGTATVTLDGSAFDEALINLGDGADLITVDSAGDPISPDLGSGDDTLAFGDGATLLGGDVEGGDGTDRVDYSAYTAAVTVNLGETNYFTSVLDGTQEVPPNASTSTGTAFLLQRPDAAGDDPFDISIEIDGITLAELEMSHLHAGAAGANGPVIVDLGEPGSYRDFWTGLTGSDEIGFDLAGKGTNRAIPAANEADLLAGDVYINIHTTDFPAGEIRGQLDLAAPAGTGTGVGSLAGIEDAVGGSEADVIIGDDADNLLEGGAGDDTVFALGGADTLMGGGGNDSLTGGQGGDNIQGEAGDDRMVWNNGDGSDLMEGGADADEVKVTGADAGDDDFQINPNGTRVDFERVNLGPFALDIGTVESLSVSGGSGNDSLTAGDLTGVEDLTGGTLFGRDGEDAIDASAQANAAVSFTAVGGAQDDNLSGSPGGELLDAGDGDDTVVGNPGGDDIVLGEGDDLNVWNNGDGSDIIEGGDGDDTQQVNGNTTLGDTFNVGEGGGRVDFERVDGGAGLGPFSLDIGTVETLDLNTLGGDDSVDASGVTDGLIGLDLDGGEGNDSLTGGDGPDAIFGGNGNDSLRGGPGVDTILGGVGDDTILGDTGNDSLTGDIGDGVVSDNEATGATPAAIQAEVDAFRDSLGQLNRNVPGSFGIGRRQIDWDAAPDGVSAPNDFPGDFFNADSEPRARGIEFSTPGTGFQLSATAASGVGINFANINAGYETAFGTFSPERLFTPIGSNVVDVNFFVPGTTTPGLVSGFGAVFTDVDTDGSTTIEYFDADDNLLTTRTVMATAGDGSLSFVGVNFGSAIVARVRITAGGAALGGADITQGGTDDLVAMDDFIFGEPVPAPGDGDDLFIWNNGDGSDVIEGGGGGDTQQVNGNTVLGDTFNVGVGTDSARVDFERVDGGAGLGPFSLDIGTVETLDLNTLGGDDTIDASGVTDGLIGLDLDGGEGNDSLTGGDGPDAIFGGNGNDSLRGGPAADVILGGEGDDTILGDTGNDTVFGGIGAPGTTTREATGADAAAIQAAVDAFRDDLGQLNRNVPGSFGFGRRQIDWDAAPDAVSAPNDFPGDFFNADFEPRARGIEFTSPGNSFQLSATAASGVGINFANINAGYATAFSTFSAERLFTPVASNVVDVNFFVPGTTTPGLVSGFGAVFTDVDTDGSTTIEYFDADDNLIETLTVMPTPGNGSLSFAGASFGAAIVARVRITAGEAALGGADITQGGTDDLVVMDDFIFGEPVPAAGGGDGDDLIIWNNGDGTDLVEGGAGDDTQQVNANPTLGDTFNVTPGDDSARLDFERVDGGAGLGPFSLDIGSTETLDLNTLGGDDTVNVTPSAVTGMEIDGGDDNDLLNAAQGGAENLAVTGPDGDGDGTVTADNRETINFENIETVQGVQFEEPVGQNTNGQIAVGGGVGGPTTVRVVDPDNNTVLTIDNAFTVAESPNGVRTAFADINGDGTPDVIVGTSPGASPQVKVFDGTDGSLLNTFVPFEDTFTGGVFVAAGDITSDGSAEIVVTPDEGGGPVVAIYDGAAIAGGSSADAAQLTRFFGIEDPAFRGGARATLGDVNADGVADVVVAAGFGGGPRIAMFDGSTVLAVPGQAPSKLTDDFFVFEDTLRNGVFIATGDVDNDGFAEVIAGGGPGGGPRVFALSGADILNGTQTPVLNFFAGDLANRGGVRLVAKDADGDEFADLVTAAGTDAQPRVTTFAGAGAVPNEVPTEIDSFLAFDPTFTGGVFVG